MPQPRQDVSCADKYSTRAKKPEEPDKDLRPFAQKARDWVRHHIYFVLVGLNAYFIYAFCYSIVWGRISKKHKGAAIATLCIYGTLNFMMYVYWLAILLWGPGGIGSQYASNSIDGDAAFQCSMQGYSIYCSYCKHLKPNRTHHSAFTDTCVPAMDHFCPWVGYLIGQGNIKFFLQFCWSTGFTLVFVIIVLLIYQHNQIPNINNNAIVLYILSGLAILFAGSLASQHFIYVVMGHTTLELMSAKRGDSQYVNFLWRDGHRRVMQLNRMDIFVYDQSPFSQGIWNNIREIMGPFYTWPLPIREPIYEPQFNKAFIEKLRERQDKIEEQALNELKDDCDIPG